MDSKKRGRRTAGLFCGLIFCGVFTLFSQSDPNRDQTRLRSADASSPESELYRHVIPAALSGGLREDSPLHVAPPKKEEKPRPARLTLR